METTRNPFDFLKLNPFTIIGLLLALTTVVFMLLDLFGVAPNLGEPSILTLLGGGLFLLIGGNDQID